jgi:adenylate cyclase
MMLVNWGNVWESFKSYSVTDLLSDKADQARASRYKDKIVIVGVVGTGSTDFGVTPRDIRSPLSRIHSHALSTMLTDVFIRQLQAFPWLVVLAIVLIALYAVGMARLSIKAALVVLVSACVVIVAIGVVSFAYLSYDVPVAEILIIFAPAAVASLAVRVATIELQALRTSRAVERYLSPELLSSIVDGEADLDISSKRVELTIVFVDIQGFSTISETVAVEYISQLLNDFLDTMTRAVFEYRGTVDKFLGDGLLAFFGDPVPLDNHAQAAVNAAVKMQRDMSELNARWTVSGIAELAGGIQIRIGINTGLVVVGNIGSTQRLEYTVVGSAVNIASRLQSLAPPGGIIMTSRTKALLKDAIQCEGPDYVRVKGIDKDIEVHRLQPEQIQKK